MAPQFRLLILAMTVGAMSAVILCAPSLPEDEPDYEGEDEFEGESVIAASTELTIKDVESMVKAMVEEDMKERGLISGLVDELDVAKALTGVVNGSVNLGASLNKIAKEYFANDEDLRLDVTLEVRIGCVKFNLICLCCFFLARLNVYAHICIL